MAFWCYMGSMRISKMISYYCLIDIQALADFKHIEHAQNEFNGNTGKRAKTGNDGWNNLDR